MTLTPNSSSLSYCSPQDVFARADVRLVADLLSDVGARVGGTQPDPNVVAQNTTLLTLIADATGDIEAACTVSSRYDPLDIQALLQASPPTAGSNYVRSLCARLVVAKLFDRRPDTKRPKPRQAEDAEKTLQMLREGERVFPFLETQRAGVVDHGTESARTVYARRMVTNTHAARFFGRRSDVREPTGPNEV